MSDNTKLVIEIPQNVFEARKMGEISPWVTVPILDAVQNGIPLDDVLDKIEAEIKETRKRRNVGVMECLDIIDRYKAESEGKPNDMTRMFEGVTEIPKDTFKGWTHEEMLEQIRAESEDK